MTRKELKELLGKEVYYNAHYNQMPFNNQAYYHTGILTKVGTKFAYINNMHNKIEFDNIFTNKDTYLKAEKSYKYKKKLEHLFNTHHYTAVRDISVEKLEKVLTLLGINFKEK